jgi:hypothetical protein
VKSHRPIYGYLAGEIAACGECSPSGSPPRMWVYLAAALLVGCSASASGGAHQTPLAATPLSPAAPAPADVAPDDVTPALDAVLIEHVPEGTFGPYLGTSSDGRALALWAALTPSSGRRWFSTMLDAKGSPVSQPRPLAEAPGELSLATVASAPSGFVALATGVTGNGTRIESLQLGRAGELISGPTPVVHERSEVLWLEALHVGSTSVALWATLGVGAADIYLAALQQAGGAAPSPVRVLEGAKAWQAVEFSDGLALAAVVAGASEASQRLRVYFLDVDGRVLGQTDVATGAGLTAQVDAARIGDNLVLGWVQREGLDERLYLAALGPDTRVSVAPRAASAPFGAQRLVEIIAPADRRGDGWLVWENVGQAPRGELRFQLARLSDQARVAGPSAELTYVGDAGARPELARKGKGLAALTRAMACPGDGRPCTSLEPTPTFVELGPELEVLASEPVRLASQAGRAPDLAWGLNCGADSCAALGALPAAPVPLFGIELRARSKKWAAAARRIEESTPRAEQLRSVAEAEPLADVGATGVGTSSLAAWLTQFDESTPYVRRTTPAPDGKLAPLRAVLSVQPFGADGTPASGARVVSYRARASSGIALAPASGERALLAWSALDRERPEAFATLLSRTGQTLVQRMLTVGAGDIGQMAAASVQVGHVVAWIGQGEGEPQLFAERLNADLSRAAPQQRLSQAPAVATAVSLLARGEGSWLASVQRREQAEVLSLLRLDPRTLVPHGPEVEIQRTEAGTLVSPTLVTKGQGALIAWIERPLVAGEEGARAWFVELDANAQRKGDPTPITSAAGDPGAVRLLCDPERCQGVLDSRPASGHVLEGFRLHAAGSSPGARLLVRRTSAAADAPAFALTEDGLFFADRRGQGGLLRRVGIRWR